MIAMALALDPQVMIMDEPTTALDVVVQRGIIREIMRLRERLGFAVIFITHDLPLLIEISDRIAVMLQGEIVELGTATRDLPRSAARVHQEAAVELPEPARRSRRLRAHRHAAGLGDAGLGRERPARRRSRMSAQPPTAHGPRTLEARNLVKDFRLRSGLSFSTLHAVKDVSFTLEAGRTIALVGESGSGKSTIAKMLARLETPTTGQILLDGKPARQRQPRGRGVPRRRADGVPGPVRVAEPVPLDRASPRAPAAHPQPGHGQGGGPPARARAARPRATHTDRQDGGAAPARAVGRPAPARRDRAGARARARSSSSPTSPSRCSTCRSASAC